MRILLLLGALVAFALPASAQNLDELAAKAKGQSLVVSTQSNQSMDIVFDAFTKKFGIKIENTVMRPSSAFTRIQTEQKNGQYGWDIWWGGTSTMVNNANPAGLLEPIEGYLLPEIKDPSVWRNADFFYGDSGHHVVAHIHELNFAILRNHSVLPEIKFDDPNDFLNPKLKGKIAMRDASLPNFGTFALATIYNAKGPEFLKKLLSDQDPKVYENPQQLQSAIMRGGAAISIGLESTLWQKCRQDGGCKDVDELPQFAPAISWGQSVPKNPPHPDAVKLWLNWFLSKEGQQTTVDAWVKFNETGALSLRKDVEPAPGHAQYLPDFTKPDQYVFVSIERGAKEIAETTRIFKEATAR
jgi:ABC-type Fe3+ transport system substrate-binding protein